MGDVSAELEEAGSVRKLHQKGRDSNHHIITSDCSDNTSQCI